MKIENPWQSFNPSLGDRKVHQSDLPYFLGFNKGMGARKGEEKKQYLLAEHLEPHPYLGNPLADVLVLMANPGVNDREKNPKFKMNQQKLEQNMQNLRHENLSSFKSRIHSPDNPDLESEWFKPRVRELVQATSVDRVTNGIFLVNFHAYHSRSWHPIPFTFPTQHYSFKLVSEAVSRNALIIMSRNMLGWFTAIPSLFDHRNRIEFESTRSVYLSEGNLGKSNFKRVVERL
jgi:hypothetical protein